MTRSERGARQRGFTFLWVLLLVALLGVGLTVVAQMESMTSQRQKERELLSIGRQYREAIGRYYESQFPGRGHEYPRSLDDLLKDGRMPGVKRHLRKIFTDPATGKAEWGLVLVAGRVAGIHSLSDAKPIKQAGFEAEDMSFADKKTLSQWVFTYPADLLLRPDMAALSASAPGLVASAPGLVASAVRLER